MARRKKSKQQTGPAQTTAAAVTETTKTSTDNSSVGTSSRAAENVEQHDHPPRRRKLAAARRPDDNQIPEFAVPTAAADAADVGTSANKAGKLLSEQHPSATSLPAALQKVESSYAIIPMKVTNSSRIRKKVTTTLSLLDTDSSRQDVEKGTEAEAEKPVAVLLSARGPVASKLISVVEIAKRELDRRGLSWYQYSGVHGQIEEVKKSGRRDPTGARGGSKVDKGATEDTHGNGDSHHLDEKNDEQEEDDGSRDEEAAFEKMEDLSRRAEGDKTVQIRNIAILTVCLSRVRIPELSTPFG